MYGRHSNVSGIKLQWHGLSSYYTQKGQSVFYFMMQATLLFSHYEVKATLEKQSCRVYCAQGVWCYWEESNGYPPCGNPS